jgi:flagellar M-ring protein FliF
MVEIIRTLNPSKKRALYGSLLLVLIVFALGVFWLMKTNYESLFEGLDQTTASLAIRQLEEKKIPFRVSQSIDGNTISVPKEYVETLRVTLVEEMGLPDAKGLELFDNADYSMTDFSQDITYKRAIQGELARTISSMPGVKAARVHITFSPKRLFSADQQAAKAAVYVEQIVEVKLSAPQIQGIQKMVANAIERLEPLNVSVFDENGIELNVNEDANINSQIDKRYQAKYMLEQKLTEKAYRLLTLSISPDKIAVSVDVTLNFDQRKKMIQGYANNTKGEGAIVKQRETSVTKENTKNNFASDSPTLSREKETEFLHGKETEETVYSSGEVEKVTVGVALGEDLSPEQVIKIKEVLSAGLGINSYRGDKLSVEVINIAATAMPQIKLDADSQPIKKTPLETTPSTTQKEILTQNLFSVSGNYWWLILLLIVPITWVVNKKRLGSQKREAMLIEVKEWLEKEGNIYVKL